MKKTHRQEVVLYEFSRNPNVTADFIAEKYGLELPWIRTLLNNAQYDYAKYNKQNQGKYINDVQLQKPEYLDGVDIEAEIKHVDVDKLYNDYMSGL